MNKIHITLLMFYSNLIKTFECSSRKKIPFFFSMETDRVIKILLLIVYDSNTADSIFSCKYFDLKFSTLKIFQSDFTYFHYNHHNTIKVLKSFKYIHT